jgi:hypothetical protein
MHAPQRNSATKRVESPDADGAVRRQPLLPRGRAGGPGPQLESSLEPLRSTRHRMVDGAVKPALVFFYSPTSGASRRAEGFLAQVLQRRRNHDTFTLHRVDYESRSDLAARCGVESPPAIVVIEGGEIRVSLEQPRGCSEIRSLLAPWLK